MRIDAVQAPAPSMELAVINIGAIVPVEFFKAGGSNDILTQLEISVRAQAAKLDISTESGREGLRSLAYQVACSKRPLDDLRKGLTEDIRKQKEAIDAEGRVAQDRLEALQKEVRKPLTDWENAEKDRVAGHEGALAAIAEHPDFGQTESSTELRTRLEFLNAFPARDWQEFKTRAEKAISDEILRTEGLLARAEKREAAIAEAKRLDEEARERAIKEREEAAAKAAKEEAERRAAEQARIAHEAAERERQRVENERIEAEARAKQAEAQRIADAELAERLLKEAEERAEEEEFRAAERAKIALAEAEARGKRIAEAAESARLAAIERAKVEQERAVEAERQRIAAAQKAEAEEAEKRAKNRAHQAAVNREVLAALIALNIAEDGAKIIIAAIAKGAVPHVTINY